MLGPILYLFLNNLHNGIECTLNRLLKNEEEWLVNHMAVLPFKENSKDWRNVTTHEIEQCT